MILHYIVLKFVFFPIQNNVFYFPGHNSRRESKLRFYSHDNELRVDSIFMRESVSFWSSFHLLYFESLLLLYAFYSEQFCIIISCYKKHFCVHMSCLCLQTSEWLVSDSIVFTSGKSFRDTICIHARPMMHVQVLIDPCIHKADGSGN